jgi:hypothetical protein
MNWNHNMFPRALDTIVAEKVGETVRKIACKAR